MPGDKILVFGGTGPAGICLLRELAHGNHAAIVYVRNPAKLPEELAKHPLLEVVKGEMSDRETLSAAMSRSSTVLSLLGPQISDRKIDPSLYADMYKNYIFPLMRQHGVRRIVAMGTVSIQRTEDHWTAFQFMVVCFMRLFSGTLYRNMLNLADAFDRDAAGLDWTVFRIAQIPGEPDEESWRKDRDDGEVSVGWIGEKGWSSSIKRALLARWLVDAAEGKADEWIGKMPAISRGS
ncbi:hypothetical protein PFICI_08260 [Pestalotiopsis fici W106-1]|uniref:NAD(P)-binding domain-containing protein n=1 Tax=Pestalotiopsis fici (strain W106-1 / CGMCC3.15140) TaxID=1229662 RepID=W3X6E8_PESFW|nr:uncharacterized protein PFICI_08260 [Pestalotiopsis fici W106-1]ETS80731.1 hypothetical protein PFICI_08260 [Pestalotiopsis fici W106-1]